MSEPGGAAGIIKTPGVDDVIDTLEAQIDFVEGFQKPFFEGSPLDGQTVHARTSELRALAAAVNRRIADTGVVLIGAFPELSGLGARFRGVDTDGRLYSVDLHLDDERRMRGDDFSDQLGGLDTVSMVEQAIRQAQREYLASEAT